MPVPAGGTDLVNDHNGEYPNGRVITVRYHGYCAKVQMSEVAMAAAVTVSIAGASYAAFNWDVLVGRAETVADQADCRAVDAAIVAYATA